MDRIDHAAITLTGIMMALSLPVNARAAEKPNFNRASRKNELKDSVTDNKSEMAQLVDYLFKNGDEFIFKEHIAPVIGLPGPMPSKVGKVAVEDHGHDYLARFCYLVYENTSDVQGGKRPLCVYLRKLAISGHDDDDRFYRISLDGQLEKVVISRAKRDDEGKPLLGSGAASYPDIESSGSKKDFAIEIAEMKKWLKAQRRLLAKANATKPNKTAVMEHAETEHHAVDHEAASAASASAPSAQ